MVALVIQKLIGAMQSVKLSGGIIIPIIDNLHGLLKKSS